jgi:BTB/POZ domain
MATATDGVSIFVDGLRFWTSRTTLLKSPYFAALFRMNAQQSELHLDRNPDLFRQVLMALRGYPCYVPLGFQDRVNLIEEMIYFQLEEHIPNIINTFDAHEKVVYESLCECDTQETPACIADELSAKPRRGFSLSSKTKSATTTHIIKQRRLW